MAASYFCLQILKCSRGHVCQHFSACSCLILNQKESGASAQPWLSWSSCRLAGKVVSQSLLSGVGQTVGSGLGCRSPRTGAEFGRLQCLNLGRLCQLLTLILSPCFSEPPEFLFAAGVFCEELSLGPCTCRASLGTEFHPRSLRFLLYSMEIHSYNPAG